MPMPMRKQPADEIEARDLALYAVNTEHLYRSRALPIIANLRRKIAKGTYDATKALKLWRYLADDAATQYRQEFRVTGGFSSATRDLAAQEIAEHYESDLHI